MKTTLYKIAIGITAILAILIWSAAFSVAQPLPVADCCQQAISFKQEINVLTGKYNETRKILDETRQAGKALNEQKDARIKALQDQANSKLTDAMAAKKVVKTDLVQTEATLAEVRSRLEDELVRGRFLGFGRRRFIKSVLKNID